MPPGHLGMAFLPKGIFFSGSGPLVDSVLHAVRAAPCGPEDRANGASWTSRTAAPLERRRSSRLDRSTSDAGPEPGAGQKWRPHIVVVESQTKARIAHARSGRIAPGSRVLFIHTGGQPALFAYADGLGFWLSNAPDTPAR